MKKKLLILYVSLLLVFLLILFAYYQGTGWKLSGNKEISADFTVNGKEILIGREGKWEPFEIRGVDMGTGIPGKWSTDFAADKTTYLRWFHRIQEMGANTVRIYTINPEAFYEAFYEFNKESNSPLYLLQGVWIDEYAQNSHIDAFDPAFADTFIRDCKLAVDVIHGGKTIGTEAKKNIAKGSFRKDVSQWVIGYIIGVEWEPSVVSFTNDSYSEDPQKTHYFGNYLYTTEDASPFEAMLCRAGDSMLRYESRKYGQQRLLAFSNWPTTDPFEYPEEIQRNLMKYCCVDAEHIRTTEKVVSGQFASYHIYPYYPNYINYLDDWSVYGIEDKKDYLINGEIHSYRAYLHALVQHHEMPVVISEFGVPSSRGMASEDVRQGFDQGGMSEAEQAEALSVCYKEIMEAGCAGSCIFSWQDEWFKRTWNTMHAVNLRKTCFWPDYQTNEQSFGLLSFDILSPEPCFNDGDLSEWHEEDLVSSENGLALYMKSDLKYVYFRIDSDDMDFENDTFFIPIDVTPKSGSWSCASNGLRFNRATDFLIMIHGENDSEILVQERYDALRSTFSMDVYGFDTYIESNTPARDSPVFTDIRLPLQRPVSLIYGNDKNVTADSYVTGKLLYGNGDPSSGEYLSNSDFFCSDNSIELRIPWQILNFSDPTSGEIHNDYYSNYGVTYMNIDRIYAGIAVEGEKEKPVRLKEYRLPKMNTRPMIRERLKESYYTMQKLWSTSERYEETTETAEYNTVQVTAELRVPALMYHGFRRDGSVSENELGKYEVFASEFENDLKYLRENGFTSLSAQDILDIEEGRMEIPENPILLTVDDGSWSVYEIAFPLLKKYNMKAVLAVIGSSVDGESLWNRRKGNSSAQREFSFCTWDEIREMQNSGHVDIISHSYGLHAYETQKNLILKRTDAISGDVFRFMDALNRQKIGITPAMAYPYSLRTRQTDMEIFETGYRLLFVGDVYTLERDQSYSFISKHCEGNMFLIPRMARLHGNDVKYWLEQIRESTADISGKEGDG